MKFDDYHISSNIKKNLAKLKFKRPTDIQYKAIPSILKGEDVLAIAQTGTGKTAAFAIPIIDIVHRQKFSTRADGVKCLVMAPTRELCKQIAEVFYLLSKDTRVRTMALYGGVEQENQIDQLDSGVDILVATPGRMFDLRSQGYLRLHRVQILVLDEADHMLDLGFIKDIEDIQKHLPKKRQTLFFSATINKQIKQIAYSLVKNAIRIQISPKDPVSKNVNHSIAFIEMDDKRYFLERLFNENEKSKILVFVRTKVRAERVQKAMERVGVKSLCIHGGKDQEERFEVLDAFKNNEVRMLIATDVSARGIDIPNVHYVVNYDLPEQAENYVHRVGRTGRGRKKGTAVSFCSQDEMTLLDEIEKFTKNKIEILEIEKEDYHETLEITDEGSGNWKKLLKDAEKEQEYLKRKKKRKKKK